MCNRVGSRLCSTGDHYVLVTGRLFRCQYAAGQGKDYVCANPLKIQIHTPGWSCYDCWYKTITGETEGS